MTGERRDSGEDMGTSGLLTYLLLSSSEGYNPSLLLWHGPGGHGRDHLVVARVINPCYYYQLSSSEGYKPALLVSSSSEGYKPALLVSVYL